MSLMNGGWSRRKFLGTAAALAGPSLLPMSLNALATPDPYREDLRRVDADWAEYLGCSSRDLHGTETVVVEHPPRTYFGCAVIFRRSTSCIVSVPGFLHERDRSRLREAGPMQLFDQEFLRAVLGFEAGDWFGGCRFWVADRSMLMSESGGARQLDDGDLQALLQLADACGEIGHGLAALRPNRDPHFGVFKRGELVAVAKTIEFQAFSAPVLVAVHPDWRGKGLGIAAARTAMVKAFDRNRVPVIRTTSADKARERHCRSLGFKPYADAASTLVRY